MLNCSVVSFLQAEICSCESIFNDRVLNSSQSQNENRTDSRRRGRAAGETKRKKESNQQPHNLLCVKAPHDAMGVTANHHKREQRDDACRKDLARLPKARAHHHQQCRRQTCSPFVRTPPLRRKLTEKSPCTSWCLSRYLGRQRKQRLAAPEADCIRKTATKRKHRRHPEISGYRS